MKYIVTSQKSSINEVLTDDKTFEITDYFDISKISKEDIHSINVDYRVYLEIAGYNFPVICNEGVITEISTDKTVPPEELKKKLKILGYKDWQIKEEIIANNVRIVVLYVDLYRNIETITKEMKSFGWTRSKISNLIYIDEIPCRAISFDPITQEDATHCALSFRYLYHVTPLSNVESILKAGLEPRHENSMLEYPPRVHLIKGDTSKETISYFGWQLYQLNDSNKDGRYAVLRITTSKIPSNIIFYGDPRFEEGLISKQTLPPECIKFYGYIDYFSKYHFYNETICIDSELD